MPPTAVALVQVACLPLNADTILRPSTIKSEPPEILTLPTTAIDQSNYTFGTACTVVLGFIVSISN